jgi:outer membrane receptor protein involved in Fe transport
MAIKLRTWRVALLAGCATMALGAALPAAASAEGPARQFSITAQDLDSALKAFAMTSGHDVVFDPGLVAGRTTSGVNGAVSDEEALRQLLAGTNLAFEQTPSGGFVVRAPRFQSAADQQAGGSDGTVQALIVTAQKREEAIQDVPIAISAFTEKSLQEQKIEGGFDLLKAIPNVTFSKNNFTSYNFSIRGIGTKAVSATTDPGVAVSFNNIALIQNRLFEQEYFDVERVEVLRGPQGTLYGRNATAGVINVISAKPNLHEFDGWLKGEVGNYKTKRVSAMVNVPLIEDKLAIRFAGALTDRQGYDYNSVTKNHVNGRDLWSGRITVGFNPTDKLRSNLIWEHFEEDDDRSRTGKQLCHRDPGPEYVGSTYAGPGVSVANDPTNFRALYSQGCLPGSLYEDAAFGTPNGLAMPFVSGMLMISGAFPIGYNAQGKATSLILNRDPYGGMMQSRDLRTIASFRDPHYSAKADVVELNVDYDVTDHLTFTSQTAWDKDTVYSFQDYNRFNTLPIFQDSSQFYADYAFDTNGNRYGTRRGESNWANLSPGGIFCDPQLGCSNTLAGFDISQAKSEQFTQEFRLQSNFDGPLNFSVGANYTHFKVLVDYYVLYNLITAFAEMPPFYNATASGVDISVCPTSGYISGPEVPAGAPLANCPYIDPNPVESINGEGHNYFRSKNPYKLSSGGYFGELYWQVKDDLKVTAGLRYNDDHKTFTPVPSQVLLAPGIVMGGYVSRGYPSLPDIKQHWGEWTGRLGVDWKPKLSFTDQTMVYAFYSRGYKGGGANPPTPGFATTQDILNYGILTPEELEIFSQFIPYMWLTGVDYGSTFKPEFVNAFEVGAKNTLLGGALQFNADAFYYDYKDYQISQIKDRTAVNENFDATNWGLEFQTVFSPSRDLQIIANLGYLDTRIKDGETSIDIMNRTAGDPRYIVVKPWIQLPSNCVVPVSVAEQYPTGRGGGWTDLCGGIIGTDTLFNWSDYPELNGGAGIKQDLGGNELPNAPHWTINLGAQYGHEILDGSWRATVRADAYWQSQSWARVYNLDPYDKLHGWYNVNLSVWFEKPDDDLKIELYAKNLLDKTPITDAFLNSDDTALTTNVFVLDPRLIGLSIRKGF